MPYANPEKKRERDRRYYLENKEEILKRKFKFNRKYYAENREQILNQKREYHASNKNALNEKSRRYHHANKDEINAQSRKYHAENKERLNRQSREYYQANKERLREYRRNYVKENREAVASTKSRCQKELRRKKPWVDAARKVLQRAMQRGFLRGSKTAEILGCDHDEFRAHFERQFTKGMTWQNWGEWHIDHIIPISSAESDEEARKLSHITNLMPVWAEENLSKKDKRIYLI